MPAPTITFPTEGQSIVRYSSTPVTLGYRYFARTSVPPYDVATWGVLYGLPSYPTGYVFGFDGGVAGYIPIDTGVGDFSVKLAGSELPIAWGIRSTDWSPTVAFHYIPPPPPTANFTVSPKEFFESKTVQFNDTSSGNPTSWSWKFRASDSGDAWVEFSTLQNPTKDFSV